MKLRLPKFLRRKNLTSDLKNPEAWLVDLMLGSAVAEAGVRVTAKRVMGLATVYACVNVIAETVATLPLKLMRITANSREPAREHPLYDLIANEPNDEMTSTDFRLAMQGALSLRRNGYAQIRRNNGGRIAELVPIHAGEVTPKRDGGRIVYDWHPFDGRPSRTFQRDEILHLRGLSLNGLQGLDLVQSVRDVFGLAIALETNAAKFFANDSRPGTILETEKALSNTAYERLKKAMDERRGVENSNLYQILEEGLKVSRARMTNNESQMDESRNRTSYDICRVFRMPPHKVALLDRATFSNIEEQSIEFATDTIAPQCTIWEQHLNRSLLTPAERRAGFTFRYNLGGLLRGDLLSRYQAYALGRNWGWLNADEVRELEDMDPLPDGAGQEYINPANMVPQGFVPQGFVPQDGSNRDNLRGAFGSVIAARRALANQTNGHETRNAQQI